MNARQNRKGLSPLIATILLLAFAVSLGTMVMSWDVSGSSSSSTCADTNIALQELASRTAICYDADAEEVRFMIRNTGRQTINQLLLRVIHSEQQFVELPVTTDIGTGELATLRAPFAHNSPNQLVGSIVPLASDTICVDAEIQQIRIPPCP